jgi:hypothetical protein
MNTIIFNETTTLGIRISEVKKRKILNRENVEVNTPWGIVSAKVKINNDRKVISPEYEECKRVAKEFNLPLHVVFDKVKSIAEEGLSELSG